MVRSILWKRFQFVLMTLVLFGASSLLSQPVEASGGSWGSSNGGLSSGGSWGSGGGLLGGRTPVRNLLSRIGGRIGSRSMGSGGSGGSGGSSGSLGSRGGGSLGGGLLRRRVNGSSGGWSGSTGGWSGSTGSTGSTGLASTGSTGYASSGSTGMSYVTTASHGSTGASYAGSSSGAIYGAWGANYLNSFNSSPSFETSYTVPNYSMGGYSVEQSYPVGDYGFEGGIPMESGSIVDGGYGAPVLDGGSIGPMLEGGIPIDGYYPVDQNSVEPNAAGTVPGIDAPGIVPEEDGTSAQPIQTEGLASSTVPVDSSVLNVVLPTEAKVFINDRLTKTPGAYRSYRSSNLKLDREYKYQVKAVMVVDGEEVVKTQLVSLTPGFDRTIKFEFDTDTRTVTAKPAIESTPAAESAPVVTKLALQVPANATVTLCGNKTKRKGTLRTFETDSLKPGKVWKGYKVEVEFERGGETVKEERSLDMIGGETYSLAIGVETATDRVASN